VTEEAAQRAGPARQPSDEPALAQAGWNLVVLGTAVVVLLATMLVARAELATLEASIFRAVNDLPQGLYTVVWPFMQYGTFITIPALALIALLFRRFRLALAIALAGIGVYLVALVVKGVVDRGRPGGLLTGVEERELFGADSLGYPSGHAAVAAALTVVVAAHLSVRWLIVALALGVVVLFGRIYVGAHLPLDVIGGAALGAIAGSIVNLIVRPRPRPELPSGVGRQIPRDSAR
jgi:undecaprenyl-diphosphatase